jgi:hypothetical protein
MRAAIIAQSVVDAKVRPNQGGGAPTARLKSGAEKHREENRSGRAEIFALPNFSLAISLFLRVIGIAL